MKNNVLFFEQQSSLAGAIGKGDQSCMTQKRFYVGPVISLLGSCTIGSGGSYLQPENSGGVWSSHS